ncbi:MAG TPA: [FeFe] hydrogenase H-cluster maturation GTPase HydF, partial [Spirochaetia bacterium]|nr:[FeFe] hydrogenase H-cluster maturation GTPase HydF [Spirochaetia bacterium]
TLTDTAGTDDSGTLGGERVRKSLERINGASLVILVSRADIPPEPPERMLLETLASRPHLVCLTHAETGVHRAKADWLSDARVFLVDNISGEGLDSLKGAIAQALEGLRPETTPLEGLVNEGDLVVLVTPIDSAAPKGRLILPQVETIRDALDRNCAALVVKEGELHEFYSHLPKRPRLVITDSQAFRRVSADIPVDQPLTSFSILFARKKGDIDLFLRGLKALEDFPHGGKVIILEACTHHRQSDDIGTVKIPRLFRQIVDPDAEFVFSRGMPDEAMLIDVKLVISCAACMVHREAVLASLNAFTQRGIPVTNYGLFLAWVNGLIPRAIEPLKQLVEV